MANDTLKLRVLEVIDARSRKTGRAYTKVRGVDAAGDEYTLFVSEGKWGKRPPGKLEGKVVAFSGYQTRGNVASAFWPAPLDDDEAFPTAPKPKGSGSNGSYERKPARLFDDWLRIYHVAVERLRNHLSDEVAIVHAANCLMVALSRGEIEAPAAAPPQPADDAGTVAPPGADDVPPPEDEDLPF